MNKKAQFETKLLAIIIIFIVAVLFFFLNTLTHRIYSEFDEYFEDSKYNDTEAHEATQDLLAIESSNIWDWAFLAIFIGFIIQIVLFSFATRISMAFYWLMVIIDLPILMVGVVLSNIWQEIAADPTFATTIVRFPITDSLLGTYFPVAVVFIIFITSIIIFGKRPGG